MNNLNKYSWQAFGFKNFEKHVRNGFERSKGFCFPHDALEWYHQTYKLLQKSNKKINSINIMNYIINLYKIYIDEYNEDVYFLNNIIEEID